MAPPQRPWPGTGIGLLAVALVTAVLLPFRDEVDTATVALVLVLPGVLAAAIGGHLAGLLTAGSAAGAFNLAFLHPYGAFTVSVAEQVVALAVLVVVALLTATLVAREAERRAAAELRAAEAATARAAQARLAGEAHSLEVAAEHRAALLRAVSHDLRTPLSTIRAVSSDLRDGGVDYDDATRDELLDLVVDEAERLDRLVANLLSMSRVEAGALEPDRQAVDVGELLDQVARRLGRLTRGHRVTVDVPLTLPPVDADWTLVEQAVINLVANAVRHAPEGSLLRLAARRGEAGWVELRVVDEGPGVPEAQRATVFEPFRRGPGSTSSGVGLAIVRAVAEAHGGTASVDEGPTGGALVRLTLPVRGA